MKVTNGKTEKGNCIFHIVKIKNLPDLKNLNPKVDTMNSCTYIKAKDPPWDAVLMGSVASTVNANIVQKLIASMFFIKKIQYPEFFTRQ